MRPTLREFRTSCLLGLLSAVALTSASAHPISITQTSVYVTREQATARIQVFLEDLYLFHQLQPNAEDVLTTDTIRRGILLHREFLRQRFEVADVQGRRYKPESVTADEVELPAEGVPLPDLMAHQLIFEFRFRFSVRPEVLMFTQRFTDEAAVLPSEMHLQVTQENAGSPFTHTLLPHEPYSLRINWNNPPLSREASEREQAEWAAREQKELLGITSYGNIYSFLYIEDVEVRHEILVPVTTLLSTLTLPRDADAVLDVTEQEAARSEIANYFATGNPIMIDGRSPPAVVDRCEFYGLDMTDFARSSRPRPLPLANARVGVILSYPVATPPMQLEMTWNRFSENILGITTIMIAGEEITRTKLRRLGRRNILTWKRSTHPPEPMPLQPVAVAKQGSSESRLRWLSPLSAVVAATVLLRSIVKRHVVATLIAVALLIGTSIWTVSVLRVERFTLSDPDALTVFRQLHANTYRAIEKRTEDSIYDALAVSVDGRLLPEIYLELRRGLEIEEQGGASVRIDSVDIVTTNRMTGTTGPANSFQVRSRWNVKGSVEHWGHLHRRTNQYSADFVIAPIDDAWKLITMHVIDERQLDAETSLRLLPESG